MNGCSCPSGDGSLRWPCPEHPPKPATPAEQRQLDAQRAAAQLDAAMVELNARLVELLTPAVEALVRYIEACAALIERVAGALQDAGQRVLDAARGRGTVTVELLPDLSRWNAAMDAGRQLDAAKIAGAFGVPVSVIEPAGDLAGVELPAGYADLHPSHDWFVGRDRAECLLCGLCTCCDAGPSCAGPCSVVELQLQRRPAGPLRYR